MESKRKLRIIVLIITCVILVLMGISFATRDTSSGHVLGTVLRPAQQLFSRVGGGIGDFFGFAGDMKNLQQENLELKEQVNALSEQVRQQESYVQENERLRKLLALASNESNRDMVGCEVIAKDPGNWFYSFTIDKGSNDGLSVDDTVVDGQGLVGRITEVGGSWAKVLSIIDADSSVGAMISRTQDFAIVDGDLSLAGKGQCKLNYLTKDTSLAVVGDAVVTSGLGGVYPKGILIGTVSEIKSDALGYSQYAVIDTAVDFERIREVMVIRSGR